MCKQYEHTIAITNRKLVQGDFLEQMQKVIHLHPHAVILREKDLSDKEYEILAEKILEMCRESGVRCFLHSRISRSEQIRMQTDSYVYSGTYVYERRGT